MTEANIKNVLSETVIDPGDGSDHIPLEYVLIRGFHAMGWKLPGIAAGDTLDAIAARISSRKGKRHDPRLVEQERERHKGVLASFDAGGYPLPCHIASCHQCNV